MTRASRTSAKTLPPPQLREPLGFAATLSDAETESLVPPDPPFVPAQARAK
jgi:hypothetical protein